MSSQNSSEPSEDQDQEDVRVADPEAYNQNQRLKEIHKARRNVLDAFNDLPQLASG